MKQKTILYANTINYNFPLKQRPHHLMEILASRGWKVHWVNSEIDPNSNHIKERVKENLEVYSTWDAYLKRNNEVDVYFSSWSHRFADLAQIKTKLVVYDSLDNFEENEKLESTMVKKSNIVLTTSQPLYDIRSKEHNNVFMCRNACFPSLSRLRYDEPKEFKELRKFGKPIVLFSGALAYWCDIELVERIGKEFTLAVVGLGWGIQAPKNIYYLGKKSYMDLQSYYHHCDVNLLPFKRCQVSDYSNPIKQYEGMVHSKITVATDIPEATIYPHAVFASSDHDEFIENIYKALEMKDDVDIKNAIYRTATENTWHHRVDTIENVINRYCYEHNIVLGG